MSNVTRPLWLRLVLPLALISAGLLVVYYAHRPDELFINLATELLGIVVTVAYVDWVLRRHEAERWGGTDSRINERLKVFVNGLISGVRGGLRFGPEVMDEAVLISNDTEAVHREILRVAKHVLSPAAHARVRELDQAGWKQLAVHLQSTWTEAERILDRFSHRLEPRQVELLLDIQKSVESALIFWRTFPDLAGVPDSKLPRTKTPPEILQEHGYNSTARELGKLLALASQLAETARRSEH